MHTYHDSERRESEKAMYCMIPAMVYYEEGNNTTQTVLWLVVAKDWGGKGRLNKWDRGFGGH